MDYSFTNGSAAQKLGWQAAADRLLNLPSSAIPLAIEVSFVDPSEVDSTHTSFASTTWTYGSTSATTKVRDDAVDFGPVEPSLRAEAAGLGIAYSPAKFYTETSAHELGHALYAALPEAFRISIARMFGATSDSLTELQPPGTPWQDQIIEAIAEVFKDAFLPRRYRVFPNRTNIKLPYSKYPEFRRLFREGVEAIKIEAEPPEYDLDIFKRNGWASGAWFDSRRGLYAGTDPGGPVMFQSDAKLQATKVLVEGGHAFDLKWMLPSSIFTLTGVAQVQFRLQFEAKLGKTILARWELIITYPFEGGWSVAIEPTETGAVVNPPELSAANPPFTITNSFTTPWSAEEKKELEVFAVVKLEPFGEVSAEDFETEFVVPFRESIPDFHFTQGGSEGVSGGAIAIEPSAIAPTGVSGGTIRGPRRVTGR